MKNDKKHPSFTSIGSSSLLVVFLILCLVTFAILSLSSAKSDYSLTERLAKHKSDYYEACAQAETILDSIDQRLEETWLSETMSLEEYLDVLNQELLTDSSTPCSMSTEDGVPIISYQIPVDYRQTLFVKLQVTDPQNSQNYYKILTWQLAPSNTWEGDDTLNLMPMQ